MYSRRVKYLCLPPTMANATEIQTPLTFHIIITVRDKSTKTSTQKTVLKLRTTITITPYKNGMRATHVLHTTVAQSNYKHSHYNYSIQGHNGG